MPHRYLTSRLASHYGTRQIEVSLHADAAAEAVDRTIGETWREVLAVLRSVKNPVEAQRRVREAAHGLLGGVQGQIAASLERITVWGHRTTAENLTQTLPVAYLAAAVSQQISEGKCRETRHLDRTKFASDANLLESEESGALAVLVKAAGLEPVDLLAPLREPARSEMSIESQKDLFSRLLFPPPSPAKVAQIVFNPPVTRQIPHVHVRREEEPPIPVAVPWPERIAALSRLAPPEQLASIVATGYAMGKSQREIAKDLLPAVNGVRSSARRIARTEGLRVASAIQMEAHEALGDLVAGYQIHAVLDQSTQPLHAARNGLVWLKTDPRPKQVVLRMELPECPTRANCRCFESPVLQAIPRIVNDPVLRGQFDTAAGRLIVDPQVYSDWWEKTDERSKRIAVGSKRFQAVRDKLNAEPTWHDFLDPETGTLLKVGELQAETPVQRSERLRKVSAVLQHRRELLRQVRTFGSLLPSK